MDKLKKVLEEVQQVADSCDENSPRDIKSLLVQIITKNPLAVTLEDGVENIGAIASLEREVEVERYKLEAIQIREQRTHAMLTDAQCELSRLRNIVNQQEHLAKSEGLSLEELLNLKSTFDSNKKELTERCQDLNEHVETLLLDLKEMSDDVKRAEKRADATQKELQIVSQERNEFKSKIGDYENRLDNLAEKYEELKLLHSEIQVTAKMSKEQKLNAEAQVTQLQQESEETAKKLEVLLNKIESLSLENEELKMAYRLLDKENSRASSQSKELETHFSVLQKESSKILKQKATIHAKLEALKKECGRADEERLSLDEQLVVLERELEELKKAAMKERLTISGLRRERDNLNKSINSLQVMTENQARTNQVKHETMRKLENELETIEIRYEKLKTSMITSELKRSKVERNVNLLISERTQMQVALAELNIEKSALEKIVRSNTIQLANCRLKNEGIGHEKEKFESEYMRAKERAEIAEIQVRRLNEEAKNYQKELIKAETELGKKESVNSALQKEIEVLNSIIGDLKKQEEGARNVIKSLEKEILKAEKLSTIKEEELKRERNEKREVIRERDILSKKIREKLGCESEFVQKGKNYRAEMDRSQSAETNLKTKVIQLELEIAQIREEKANLQRRVLEIAALKKRVHKLELQLDEERLRCSALENDKKIPMRVPSLCETEAQGKNKNEELFKLGLQRLFKVQCKKTSQT
ncbi:cilia- and flagella-associated protein 58-like isoform X2 [Artemia franciscana]|uniref:cilia- and flagella-associated protein 58-like isoform X2 n=1 Tax=Artemia franciscana TaxID=6661 RepID=UPI0032DAF676